jgi:hypothetical protein
MLPAFPTGCRARRAPHELVDELEGRGLLTLEAELVDRVDQRDRVALGQLAHQLERLVEVAAQAITRRRA